jgi:hypothetical protein
MGGGRLGRGFGLDGEVEGAAGDIAVDDITFSEIAGAGPVTLTFSGRTWTPNGDRCCRLLWAFPREPAHGPPPPCCHSLDDGLTEDPNNVNNQCAKCAKTRTAAA